MIDRPVTANIADASVTDQTDLVYAAEDLALGDTGRRFSRWTDVAAYVDAVVASDWWAGTFPHAPQEVEVLRRSRSATASLASRGSAAIAIRDGSWTSPVILHELAHLAAPRDDDHGPSFAAAFLVIAREHLGFAAYGALASAFAAAGVEAAPR